MFLAYPKPEQVSNIMKSVLYEYHGDVKTPVVFDKSRIWPDHAHIMKNYFGIENPKIIVTVRDIDYILSSFIRIVRKNSYDVSDLRLNFIDKWLVSCNLKINDESRCNVLMDKNGVVGESIIALTEGLAKNPESIHLVEYNDLVMNPKLTLKKIYDFLEEEYYDHDFKNVTNDYLIDDIYTYGLSGLHDVRNEIKYMSPDPREILPKSVIEKCQNKKPWLVDNHMYS